MIGERLSEEEVCREFYLASASIDKQAAIGKVRENWFIL
jgi:hypothetical protein